MRIVLFALIAVALTGCGLIYRQDIQQGNVLEQEQVDQLSPGMTRRQVALILGTPAVTDPFHRDRWDYVSVFKPGGGKLEKRRQLTLFFEGNELMRIEGDIRPSGAEVLSEADIERTIEDVKEGRDRQLLERDRPESQPAPPDTDTGPTN